MIVFSFEVSQDRLYQKAAVCFTTPVKLQWKPKMAVKSAPISLKKPLAVLQNFAIFLVPPLLPTDFLTTLDSIVSLGNGKSLDSQKTMTDLSTIIEKTASSTSGYPIRTLPASMTCFLAVYQHCLCFDSITQCEEIRQTKREDLASQQVS